MPKMFIKIPKDGYHFKKDGIAKIEEHYNAKYMGYWCTKNLKDGWNDQPVDVFYVANPDTSKGHSNYFGMFTDERGVMITDAKSAFSQPMTGIICSDGEVIVSRYRHDCVVKEDAMIDGGRDYTRMGQGNNRVVMVTVDQDRFVFSTVAS